MANSVRVDPRDDGAERATLDDEARLLRGVRWRLVAWSGISTAVVLGLLGVTLYAVVAGTLAAASVDQLEARVAPVAEAIGGPDGDRGEPNYGFSLGEGNTLLYLFDAEGASVQDGRRPVIVPEGLPEPDALEAARADGEDVRTSTLTIASRTRSVVVPIRILTQSVVATDGNTYFLQALQERTTEVETLDALLTVLVVGGVLVVAAAVALGTIYARRALVPIRQSLEAQRSALRRQREFAADASHELRTPLTVIRSSVEHLSRHRDRPLGESSEALDDIDAEAAHLSLMVDDLLLLARSDSGAVPLERLPLDLGDITSDAASALARTAEDRGVRIAVDPEPAMLTGDPARLRQLVTILVDNAIRHSPRGGSVTVLVRARSGTVSLEVADEGPGLRPEDMEHVFDRFYRAPGAPTGGTGQGLAIARWIAERHGGRIGVRNGGAGGAVFRAELPARDGGAGSTAGNPPAASVPDDPPG